MGVGSDSKLRRIVHGASADAYGKLRKSNVYGFLRTGGRPLGASDAVERRLQELIQNISDGACRSVWSQSRLRVDSRCGPYSRIGRNDPAQQRQYSEPIPVRRHLAGKHVAEIAGVRLSQPADVPAVGSGLHR